MFLKPVTSDSSSSDEDAQSMIVDDGEGSHQDDSVDELERLRQQVAELNLKNEKLDLELQSAKSSRDVSVGLCSKLWKEQKTLEEELRQTKESLVLHKFDIRRFSEKAHMVKLYTGFTSFDMLMACFHYLESDAAEMQAWKGSRTKLDGERLGRKNGPLPKLSLEMQFFFVCVRLRQGLVLDDLADRFKVDSSTLSSYFTSWVNLIYVTFKEMLVFPSRRRIDKDMPKSFKIYYPTTRVIIDCTEFFIERPSRLSTNNAAFSAYKNHTTCKSLIGITPNGTICFVSTLYEGSISDRDIVIDSGFISLMDHGDSVMADKGFNIQDLLAPYGVRLNIPPFNTKAHQMLPQGVVKTKSIAAVRIHVERAINRIKQYRLLDGVIDNNLFDILEQAVFSACVLCNYQPTLVAT